MKPLLTLTIYILLVAIASCKKNEQGILPPAPPPTNKPIANAGIAQTITLPTDTVTLDGSASAGVISSYQWRKVSGPSSFSIQNATAVKTVVKNLVQGVYQFELRITDVGGLSAKDTMTIAVIKSSCFAQNLKWTLASNGMMALINPSAMSGTLDCAGYGVESWIPSFYDVWVQFEGSSDWVHLEYVFRNAIAITINNIFLSSTIFFDPNDGEASVPIVYAKPNSGIDFTKKASVINTK